MGCVAVSYTHLDVYKRQHLNDFFHKLLVYLVSVQLHRQHNVFKDIQHRHQIVVLENKADFSSAENGQFLVFELDVYKRQV